MNKNRSELIALMTERLPNLTAIEVKKLVKMIFNSLSDSIVNGERIELRGFGCFSNKERSNITLRNPKTGKVIDVSTKRKVVYFRPGKDLKKAVNNVG